MDEKTETYTGQVTWGVGVWNWYVGLGGFWVGPRFWNLFIGSTNWAVFRIIITILCFWIVHLKPRDQCTVVSSPDLGLVI